MKHSPVLYIITKLELGGAQKVCLSLFNHLAQAATPTFLLTGSEGILANQFNNNPNVFFLKSFKREIGISLLLLEIKSFYEIIKIIRSLKKSYPALIVHTHSTKAGLMGRWAAFFAGVKTRVHTIHGHAFNDYHPWYAWWPIYFLELITSLITTHFICVSYADSATGKKLFPFFERKHSLIRAAVEVPLYIPAYKDTPNIPAPFIFGTIACFKPQKNLLDLLKAFERAYCKAPFIRLEIIGDGVLRSQLEQWIKEKKLPEVITLHGWQKDVYLFLQRWDAFALTSLWEGLPCSIVEARLYKLPAIAYNTGGISDVIVHGKNGLLYPQKAWEDFASGMLKLATDKALYHALANHHDSLQDFYEKSMIEHHQKMYLKLQKEHYEKLF